MTRKRQLASVLILLTASASHQAFADDPKHALICRGGVRHFNLGDGTYILRLDDIQQGAKHDATVCIEGATNNCERALIRKSSVQWKTGETWTVNIKGDSYIQVRQSEYDDAHAAGPSSDQDCTEGQESSATTLRSTRKFSVTISVEKR